MTHGGLKEITISANMEMEKIVTLCKVKSLKEKRGMNESHILFIGTWTEMQKSVGFGSKYYWDEIGHD